MRSGVCMSWRQAVFSILLNREVVVARTVFWSLVVCLVEVGILSSPASAQDASMSGMHMPMENHEPSQLPSPHAGSGTGWEPASVPAREWMLMRGGWELMAHGVIFASYNQQGGPRGEGKAESVNWGMLMEQHGLGRGT